LNIEELTDNAAWFAIWTNPKQEVRTCLNLEAWGLECFNPKIKERRCNQFTGIATFVAASLFPCYVFSRFRPKSLLHKVSFVRGVQRVVSFSGKPTPIDEEVIAFLKSRVDDEGFLSVGEPLKPGDKVRIKDGIWKDVVGVIDRDLNPSERTRILITTIEYQGCLTIEKESIEKIA